MSERLKSLNEAQAVQKWWEERIIGQEGRVPHNRFTRFLDEVVELGQAIQELNGSPKKQLEAGMELADVFIVGLSIADALGYDIERLIFEKFETNFKKYNPVKIREMVESGMTWQEAIATAKSEWRANHDNPQHTQDSNEDKSSDLFRHP